MDATPDETPEQRREREQRESDVLGSMWECLKLLGAKGNRQRNMERNRADPRERERLEQIRRDMPDNGEPY